MRTVDSTGFVFGEIDSLPGCSQIAVSHAVFCNPTARNCGFGNQAHKERLALMKKLGYDFAVCTVDLSNKYQISILEEHDWDLLAEFDSSKTGHEVGIYGKQL